MSKLRVRMRFWRSKQWGRVRRAWRWIGRQLVKVRSRLFDVAAMVLVGAGVGMLSVPAGLVAGGLMLWWFNAAWDAKPPR